MKWRYLLVAVLLAVFASLAGAQRISPVPGCATSPQLGTYPASPLTYPMPSNRYRVDYKVNGGAWTQSLVNISYYGGTNSSPFFNASGYPSETSMSFTSITVSSDAVVQLRVTKSVTSEVH